MNGYHFPAPLRLSAPTMLLLGAALTLASACGRGTAHAGSRDTTGSAEPTAAVCVLHGVGDSGARGTLELRLDDDRLHVTGTIEGLTPGLHGFHVHEFGDLRDVKSGKSAGGHFAPHGHEHGKPDADVRHVGDLGNVRADERGVARVDVRDAVISLHGEHSVLGRCIVVHAGEDKFTQPSGDAGDRVAIGVIGVAAGR